MIKIIGIKLEIDNATIFDEKVWWMAASVDKFFLEMSLAFINQTELIRSQFY